MATLIYPLSTNQSVTMKNVNAAVESIFGEKCLDWTSLNSLFNSSSLVSTSMCDTQVQRNVQHLNKKPTLQERIRNGVNALTSDIKILKTIQKRWKNINNAKAKKIEENTA